MGLPGDPGPLPPTIGALMGSRLDRLSPPCRAVLDVAAVIGREFDDGLLAATCDLPSSALLDALDEAVQQRIAIPVRGATNRYRFVHALMRDAVYGRLPESRRRDLHQRIATWVERRSSGDLEAAAADLSHHFREGGEVPRIGDRYPRRRACQGVLAYEARRYFELALTLGHTARRWSCTATTCWSRSAARTPAPATRRGRRRACAGRLIGRSRSFPRAGDVAGRRDDAHGASSPTRPSCA
jgi:hypothetical protein